MCITCLGGNIYSDSYWYICALVLPSHSFSFLDHSSCAYGYSEVSVVVIVCSVSVGSTAVRRDMVSI